MNKVYVVNFDETEYGYMQQLQQDLIAARVQGKIPDVLLMLEHSSVVTVGRAGGNENLLLSKSELAAKGIELHASERGGNITYHGPGQLVVYPIINLRDYGSDVHWYVRKLEEMTINLLAEYDLSAATAPGRTGVWFGDRKIAAIGVGIKKWVTYHGLALNVNNDLSPFNYIVPCGLKDFGVTSLRERLGCEVSMSQVREDLERQFARTFEAELLPISPDHLIHLSK